MTKLIPNNKLISAGDDPHSIKKKSVDVELKSTSGDVLFSQEGIEAPATWTDQQVQVVANKYFYGDASKGSDPVEGGRENSVFALVHRVARTIADAGYEQGYFDSEEDAQAFYAELCSIVLGGYAAFNSPVWFNVGLGHVYGAEGGDPIYGVVARDGYWVVEEVDPYERPQASACFITRVGDSIDDIFEVAGSTSARLFKYGSGVGADWSALRSTKDSLSGGGVPSGPVSFMKVQDSTAGTIKSGGKTRRAAIMQTLKCWHPDVMEFITAKQEEERKAWALIEQGYDGSFNGDAYGSVAFQNVNQSVRVTDEFMKMALSDGMFTLRSPVTGDWVESVSAKETLGKIAEGTHVCGDPGLQYEDMIQLWHTCKNSGPINSSNPCSEYLFLDDSACNLASLNLRKFQRPDGTFNTELYRHVVRVMTTAMDVLVDLAGYPTWEIAKNSHEYRPLGLGFANLGAFLMSMGLPYDSDNGRAVAGALMALMDAEAKLQSTRMAEKLGPFTGWPENRQPYLKVLEGHHDAAWNFQRSGDITGPTGNHVVADFGYLPDWVDEVMSAAVGAYSDALSRADEHGIRNAQLTVLAPTGTISFMMGCDTTGIEPAFSLVQYKTLAGKADSVIKIVNHTVKDALDYLCYGSRLTSELAEAEHKTESEAILAHIEENDTIVGAPYISDDHLRVFETAGGSENTISFEGHVKMMAACQPFISGAISKTVNLPEDATVEDIERAYVMGWEMGLKALAVYRDGSKRSQPISTKREAPKAEAPKAEERVVFKPVRHKLPDERDSVCRKFSVAGHEGYLHVGLYPSGFGHGLDGKPGEIFITMAKQGSTIAGLMDAIATSVSLALQYGVPLDELVDKFSWTSFEPSGFTNDADIPMARSLVDYIFRWLGRRFASSGDGAAALAAVEVASLDVAGLASTSEGPRASSEAPPCPNCGSITVRSGSCHSCPNCGATTGCG